MQLPVEVLAVLEMIVRTVAVMHTLVLKPFYLVKPAFAKCAKATLRVHPS